MDIHDRDNDIITIPCMKYQRELVLNKLKRVSKAQKLRSSGPQKLNILEAKKLRSPSIPAGMVLCELVIFSQLSPS